MMDDLLEAEGSVNHHSTSAMATVMAVAMHRRRADRSMVVMARWCWTIVGATMGNSAVSPDRIATAIIADEVTLGVNRSAA